MSSDYIENILELTEDMDEELRDLDSMVVMYMVAYEEFDDKALSRNMRLIHKMVKHICDDKLTDLKETIKRIRSG